MPTKYGNYCVCSNYGFTLSLSLSWIVFWARLLMLFYALAICLPTRAYAASLLSSITLELSSLSP
jgi:hypothetical protein